MCRIPSEIYYPLCLHLQGAFHTWATNRGQIPVAETTSHEVLSLPVYPELSDTQQDIVVGAIEITSPPTRRVQHR